jgi:hypothetical protein
MIINDHIRTGAFDTCQRLKHHFLIIQPFAAAALTMAYSPLTLYAAMGSSGYS